MGKLELKQIAPYLPYGLNIGYFFEGKMICKSPMVSSMIGNSFTNEIPINTILENDGSCKPILRPLSDLTKEIEHNGERFIPLYKMIKEDKAFTTDFIHAFGYEELKVSVYELLLECHFDVFGLIEKGLAIDINTLYSRV